MVLTPGQRRRVLDSKVKGTLRDLRRLNKSAVKGILGDLRRTKIEITNILKEVDRFEMPYYRALLSEIDGRIADFTGRMTGSVVGAQNISFEAGDLLSDDILKVAEVGYGFPKVSEALLATTHDLSADLVTDMSDEMRRDISRSIRRSMLVGENQFQAARKIDKIIGVNKKVGYMNRSDKIARTEIGRAFSVARQAKDEMVAEQIPEMKKQWITAQDERVRPSPLYPQQMKQTRRWNHRAAHGQIRKVDEPFDVAGEKLMYPRDETGSPENVIGCRCQSVPYMEGWE
jgi:hypothetical protein